MLKYNTYIEYKKANTQNEIQFLIKFKIKMKKVVY